jgi:Zn-dependent protease
MKALLFLLTTGKLAKVLFSGGSMLLSIAVYATRFGWAYAAGFVGLIFVHEAGHYVAAKQRGLDVGLPTFIPFVGAWIQMKDQPHNVETEAYVAFAGPFIGTLGALGCYYLGRYENSDLLLALAYAGFFLNLFNLIPISPLDGGRITAIISRRIWLVGVPILCGIFFYNPSPMLILVAIMALPQLSKAWNFKAESPDEDHYYTAPLESRIGYAICYLGLAIFLAMMMTSLHEFLG